MPGLGVKPVINGVGVVTVLGGSIMPPEVIHAMGGSSRYFIHCLSWKRKWGRGSLSCYRRRRMVNCGAASAIA